MPHDYQRRDAAPDKHLAEINWTEEAQVWLRDIYDYIAQDNKDAAARTVSGIFLKSQLLKQHPRIGHQYEAASPREVRILLLLVCSMEHSI